MKTIRQQLLIWLLGGILFSTILASFAIYLRVEEETQELFDYQLQQIAAAVRSPLIAQPSASQSHLTGRDIVLQVWDANGQQIYASHLSMLLPRIKMSGFTDIVAHGQHWRVFSDNNPDRHVQVAQLLTERNELVLDAAIRSLFPFLILTPVLALIISLVVKRALAPLRKVVSSVEQRSANLLHPLSTNDMPPDIRPLIDAINSLLARLENALNSQRAFVADASHELRSPLTAIKLQLQLAERAESEEERAQAFEKLNERLDRSTHLLQQLLTLARHEPEISKSDFTDVNLVGLAKDTILDLLSFAESRSIEISLNASKAVINVNANKSWLAIMLRNLVDNAIRYTPVAGTVDIHLFADEVYATLQVIDSGVGIPESEHERVFHRFYRREGELMQGSGLGLSIAKSIVERHNGTIVLQPNPLRNGLSVSVRFLLKDA